MENGKSIFAFKLANREDAQKSQDAQETKWQVRDGVTLAGCTDPTRQGDYRYSDRGIWC